MLELVKEFRVGRPQIFAGLMLLAFLAQCLWVAQARKISELEYQYIASGMQHTTAQPVNASPFTSLVAALPVKATVWLRKIMPASFGEELAVPHPWFLRL